MLAHSLAVAVSEDRKMRAMPKLVSDDREVSSSLAIEFTQVVSRAGLWLPYRLEIASGTRRAALEDTEAQIGRCWLGLSPQDELGHLVRLLDTLVSGASPRLRFEPAEPNFSLEIERAPEGWVVVCWLDAGNQISDHFTWDAMGVRFFTNLTALGEFRDALARESSRWSNGAAERR